MASRAARESTGLTAEQHAALLAPIRQRIDQWREARQHLADLERAEHPDITDRYDRVWTWSGGDLYSHDDTLAFPEHMISSLDLPSPRLADNPNYSRLCEICRSGWDNKNDLTEQVV